MKNQRVITVVFLLAILIPMAAPLIKAAATLAPPTLNLPNHWQQSDSTTYPDAPSEHDPAGAGMLEYTDQTNYDVVRIYYEKAVSNYTSQQLNNEAVNLFEKYDSSDTLSVDQNGTTTYAGVSAGFAKGHDATDATYTMELAFIKGQYYFNVHAYYDDVASSQNNVDSIVNSISVSGAGGPIPWLYVIIGAVAAVIVIVIAVMLLTRRKKSPQPQQQAQYSYPPPPPPPPTK